MQEWTIDLVLMQQMTKLLMELQTLCWWFMLTFRNSENTLSAVTDSRVCRPNMLQYRKLSEKTVCLPLDQQPGQFLTFHCKPLSNTNQSVTWSLLITFWLLFLTDVISYNMISTEKECLRLIIIHLPSAWQKKICLVHMSKICYIVDICFHCGQILL